MLSRIAASALVGALFSLSAGAAFAEEPAETAIRGWVASIDASADWAASFRSLTYDAATRTAVLSGLAIRSEQPGLQVEFNAIDLTGFNTTADGGFTAAKITTDGGQVEMGPFKVAFADVEINELTMPSVTAVVWDSERPFTSLIKAYAPLSRIAMTNGRIGSIALEETNEGVTSKVAYDQFRIDRWANGKIAAVTAGPLHMEAPDPDGLVTMKVASFESRDLDLDATLRVLDPDRYVGGVGDGVWHQVASLAAYHDFSIEGPAFKVKMDLLSTQDFKLRQPKQSFAAFLDKAMAHPNEEDKEDPEAISAAIGMLSAYGIGRIGISGLDVTATGIDGIHLGSFNMSDLSIDRLGEFAINDFAAAVADQGSIKVGRFAFGDVVLPGADAMIAAATADAAGEDVDYSALAPKLGFIEAAGIDFTSVDVPRTTLDSLRIDLKDYLGVVPTSIAADVKSLVFPVTLLDASGQAAFRKLGYDTIDVSYGLKANWREQDETVNVDRASVTLKGAGTVDLSLLVSGLPREALLNPDALEDVIPGLSLHKASVTLKDDSIVAKGLDLLAERMHAQPEKFRQQFADAMPLLLSVFVMNDPQLTALVRESGLLVKLAPVVKAFVASPGSSITVNLAPPKPLGIADIAQAAQDKPDGLIELLGLTVASTGTPPVGGSTTPSPAPQQPETPASGKLKNPSK